MAKGGWTASRVAEILGEGRAAVRGRDERVRVDVRVDPTCPRELVLAARDALLAERPGGVVEVSGLAGGPAVGDVPDVAVVLAGRGPVGDVVRSYALSGVPVCLVVEGALDAPAIDLPEPVRGLLGVVAASSPESLPDKLADWLVSSTSKQIALAANFPFCRTAVVESLITRCAVENAAVGAVSLIPGSDLPIMCANQAKLALDIAACYGRGLEVSRVAELAGVLGAGFVWRAAARSLVGLVPGVGGILKAGVGYGGTYATGSAIRMRFELQDRAQGAPGDAGGPTCVPEAPLQPQVLLSAPADEGYVTIGAAS